MEQIITQSIALRGEGKYEESRILLKKLLQDKAYAAKANLHIAWAFDNEGKETEAIKHYKLALKGPISSEERFDTMFGLACTYRSLGEYQLALGYFDKTLSSFPDTIEVKPFYAMCLYNLGRHKEAVSLLLELLVNTTNANVIKDYQKAIRLYAADLDKTW